MRWNSERNGKRLNAGMSPLRPAARPENRGLCAACGPAVRPARAGPGDGRVDGHVHIRCGGARGRERDREGHLGRGDYQGVISPGARGHQAGHRDAVLEQLHRRRGGGRDGETAISDRAQHRLRPIRAKWHCGHLAR